MTPSAIVGASFDAFHAQDADTARHWLADDFAFTSPQDDRIGVDDYMERCFPTADRFVGFELLDVLAIDQERVFVHYEYELADGNGYRNTEVITVHDGLIVDTQVFFGGKRPR